MYCASGSQELSVFDSLSKSTISGLSLFVQPDASSGVNSLSGIGITQITRVIVSAGQKGSSIEGFPVTLFSTINLMVYVPSSVKLAVNPSGVDSSPEVILKPELGVIVHLPPISTRHSFVLLSQNSPGIDVLVTITGSSSQMSSSGLMVKFASGTVVVLMGVTAAEAS